MSADVEPLGSAVVNGVRFDILERDELVRAITHGDSHTPRVVRFCATHPVVLARRDESYRELLNGGHLTIPDGIGPALAARLLGAPFRRTPGVEAMQDVIDTPGVRHFFFGATEETIASISRRLVEEAGEAALAGAEAPPFRPLNDSEWDVAADRIRASGADVVWVGLGVPKQDYAAEKLFERCAAPTICCVGAAFDFYAGSKHRAPVFVRRLGLEWIYRLFQEPSRLWRRYLVGNALFVYDFARFTVSRRDRTGVAVGSHGRDSAAL